MSDNAPNVAYILPSLTTGGAELQSIGRMNALQRHCRVYPVILSSVETHLDLLQIPEEQIYRSDCPSHLYNFKGLRSVVKQSNEVYKFCRQHQVNVVIASMNLSHVAARLLKIRYRLGRRKLKIVIYHHSTYFDMNPANTLPKKMLDRVNSYLAGRLDDATLFISKHVKDVISGHSVVSNPVVIYNGMPDISIAQEKLDRREDCYTILVPGRIHPFKGQDLFLEAFAGFVEQEVLTKDKIRVIFAGGGDPALLTPLLNRYSLQDYTSFLGVIPREELVALYETVDLVVIPSRFEGLGNAAIEGLMSGALMLCADVGGLREVIQDGETGYFFTAGDSSALLDKLVWIYNHRDEPLIDAKVLKQKFKDKFSMDTHVSILIETIDSLLDK